MNRLAAFLGLTTLAFAVVVGAFWYQLDTQREHIAALQTRLHELERPQGADVARETAAPRSTSAERAKPTQTPRSGAAPTQVTSKAGPTSLADKMEQARRRRA